MLLLRVLQDAFRAEHLPVLQAVELDFLCRVLLAVHDLCLLDGLASGRRLSRAICSLHGQTRQDLVVDGQVVGVDLMAAFVVGALDHAVLGQLAGALSTKCVTAG